MCIHYTCLYGQIKEICQYCLSTKAPAIFHLGMLNAMSLVIYNIRNKIKYSHVTVICFEQAGLTITKTCLFKYTEIFTTKKMKIFR